MPAHWTYFHGYPVGWRQERQTIWGPVLSGGPTDATLQTMKPEYGPVEPLGSNWVVPFLMRVLAVALPPLAGWRLARMARRGRRRPAAVTPRWVRLIAAVALAAVVGLAVALLDAVTTPCDSPFPQGLGAVPFDREPGLRLREYPAPFQVGNLTVLRFGWEHPRSVQWLRAQRAAVLPAETTEAGTDIFRWPDPDGIARAWAARTRRAGWAALIGLLAGVLVFRPWRTQRPNELLLSASRA
jgi:hypothetical protein